MMIAASTEMIQKRPWNCINKYTYNHRFVDRDNFYQIQTYPLDCAIVIMGILVMLLPEKTNPKSMEMTIIIATLTNLFQL